MSDDRAAQILEQQRIVAARLKQQGGNGDSSGGAVTKNVTGSRATAGWSASTANRPTKMKPPPPQKRTGVRIDLTDEPTKIASKSAASIPKERPAVRKRPTSFKSSSGPPQPPPPTTAAAVLIQARSRLAGDGGALTKSDKSGGTASSTSAATSSKLSQWASSVASLAQSNGSSIASVGADLASTSYGQIEPDDFWRNLRDWDLLTAIVKEKSGDSTNADLHQHVNTATHKPLPDIFVSHRHYMAAWAPLCLAETRAQLLQEVMSFKLPRRKNFNNDRGNGGEWSSVLVMPSRGGGSGMSSMSGLGGSTMLDYITIVLRLGDRQDKNANRFKVFPHDLFLLVPERHFNAVERALYAGELTDSDASTMRKYGLVGHAEQSRSSLDGLQLKVSKRWWAIIHETTDEAMRLLPLGSNVTALREFTALCRVESIPLKRFLLGQHLAPMDPSRQSQHASLAANKSKRSMIHAMGGVDALGKGFTKYAKEKFNSSQLAAISASSSDYGEGGFTLIQGPPGTGKTTTLVAVLNSLHIRQFNKYYEEVREIASNTKHVGNRKVALNHAVRAKPRLLVCAPSNAAVDNIILKIMEEGFKDGGGARYNPSMIRVGNGQSAAVKDVALESKIDSILAENLDLARLESSIAGYKMELQRTQSDITRLRRRIHALTTACPWPLSKDWEMRIDENTFEQSGRVYFVNHNEKATTFEVPPPPEPGETQYEATSMPEYRAHISKIVKLVEKYNSVTTKLERCTIVRGAVGSNKNARNMIQVRQQLETHVLDSVHVVMTTLGSAGNRVLEAAAKFEVVVVDEAAQSVEPATLSALQLGSKHSILVGDPQQLPATIFNVSGRNTKYDRSLFQRLEEAGHKVYMLNKQYRMNPAISHFPREIFYGGNLLDGPNVVHPEYGNPLRRVVLTKVQAFQPFTVLDLDSQEERGGTSLANSAEAKLATHLYSSLRELTGGLSAQSRVAVITPYAQQANLLRRDFSDLLGSQFTEFVEVNTVDGFQGREANIVIFSCVRAAGSHGIGFLSDVRRMNVALTRAKHFLFVIARCRSITVNPYWRQLVEHARERNALVPVHMAPNAIENRHMTSFPPLPTLRPEAPRKRKAISPAEEGEVVVSSKKTADPRKRTG